MMRSNLGGCHGRLQKIKSQKSLQSQKAQEVRARPSVSDIRPVESSGRSNPYEPSYDKLKKKVKDELRESLNENEELARRKTVLKKAIEKRNRASGR